MAVLAGALVVVTTASVFKYNTDFFYRRTAALGAEPVGEDLFRVAFPFLGGSQVFEATLSKFKHEHPDKSIDHIYTVPNPLRLKKADALIFYIATKDRVAAGIALHVGTVGYLYFFHTYLLGRLVEERVLISENQLAPSKSSKVGVEGDAVMNTRSRSRR